MDGELTAALIKRHKGLSFVGVTTCFFCHDGEGAIFMAKRSNETRDEQGRWDFGAGGLDWGLTAETNVIKEIQEEYSATPISTTFLGYRDVFRQLPDGTRTHWLALDFIAHVRRDEMKVNEPHKFDDSGWFTLESLPSPLHSQNITAFEKYEKELRMVLGKKK